MRHFHPRCAALGIATLAAACSGGVTDPGGKTAQAGLTAITLQSDPGDVVGSGRSYAYSRSNAVILVTPSYDQLLLRVQGDESWSGAFQLPSRTYHLVPGTYAGLTRYPLNDFGIGGLEWEGPGGACSALTGTVTVDTATYVADNLTGVDLRFEQRCSGAAASLRGSIRWRLSDATLPPGPQPIPSNIWKPSGGAVPSTGDYVYLESDPGDPVLVGKTAVYPSQSGVAVVGQGGLMRISVGSWDGRFEAMYSLSHLQTGYYPNLKRWQAHNPARGGLAWDGGLTVCRTADGWFVVDRVSYAGDTLTGISLRFEQRCDGAAGVLRGAVRWGV